MRRVLFAHAAELPTSPTHFRQLRADWSGCITPVALHQPKGSNRADVLKNLKADLIVICVDGAPTETTTLPPPSSNIVPDTATKPETGQNALFVSLTSAERAWIPDSCELVVATSRGMSDDELPRDLEQCRRFNLASPEGRDALGCRVVHGKIQTRPPESSFERVGAVLKVGGGLVATMIGNLDSTRDYLVDQLGRAALYVHYLMALLVLALILSGVVALLAPLIGPLFRMMHRETPSALPRWWRQVVLAAAVVVGVSFVVYAFPMAPSIDKLVADHTHEWGRRLSESQMAEGGLREHPTTGHAQSWLTAQGLTALLTASPGALADVDYRRAYRFLDRTRIVDATLKPATTGDLSATLLQHLSFAYDASRLPKIFPSVGFAYDIFAFQSGRAELPVRTVEILDARRGDFFDISSPARGWGYFGQFEWGVTEIAGWIGVALAESLRHPTIVTTADRPRTVEMLRAIATHLMARQIAAGGFSPIGDVSRPEFARTYSTVMAAWALSEISDPSLSVLDSAMQSDVDTSVRKAIRWLGVTAETDGWKVNPNNPTGERPFLGLSAQALCVLGRVRVPIDQESQRKISAVTRFIVDSSKTWLNRELDKNDRTHDSDRYLFPTTLVIENSTFLWYPWTLALMNELEARQAPDRPADTGKVSALRERLRARIGTYGQVVGSSYNYVAAEALIGLHWKGRRR